jgi:large subunit ribosomal protein L23
MALFGAKQSTAKKTFKDNSKEVEFGGVKDVKKVEAKKETAMKDPKKTEASMKDLYAAEVVDKKTSKAGKKTASNSRFDGAFRVLVKPLVTEKATELANTNKYVFVITKPSNKIEVAKAIYAVYGVRPLDVNIVSMQGKRVSRGRIQGKRKDWKKAIVTLKKGDSIKIYEGV